MKRKTILLFGLFSLAVLSHPAGQKIKEKDLPAQHRDFLKLSRYIMLDQEKDVFLKLTSGRDRDIFIEAFWKQRDPTPGTPQNEHKEEIIKRFNYANEHFRRQSAREGWLTDMGRFYIILGPPVSIERFDSPQAIHPAQIWSYYGDPGKGLPSHFVLVFYQKGGAGEYKLYDPVSDGPDSLLIEGKFMDTTNYEELYDKIREVAPTLALVCLSMIPGEIPFNYQPSAQNAIMLADILQSPKKDINPAYATHFLDYKGMVSTEYMTNFVESESSLALIQDPATGLNFLHFSIVPKSMSVDFYEPNDQYFCNFSLNVSLRAGEEVILQYSRDFPLYFPASDIKRIQANGISIEDSFPVIAGNYKFIVLLQNAVGKEFSLLEKDISVPEAEERPHLNGPFIGYRLQDYRTDLHLPFKVLDKKLLTDPQHTFAKTDTVAFVFNVVNVDEELWEKGQVGVVIQGAQAGGSGQKSLRLRLSSLPFQSVIFMAQSLPASDLPPDYYELRLTLLGSSGEVLDEAKKEFIVSPVDALSHPISHSKSFSLANRFFYFGLLAKQYEKVKDFQKAGAYFQKAYGMNPDYKPGVAEYASFLLETGEYARCLELVEGLKEDEKFRFNYYLIKGRAYLGLGNYSEAVENLLEGNKIYNSDTRLLNALGYSFFKTNRRKEALEVLSTSLRLNPGQEEVKKLIAVIEKSG